MNNKERNGLPEIYGYYKKKCREDVSVQNVMNYKKFASIVKDFNKEVSKLILSDGIEFKMPLRLGSIRVRKFRNKLRLNPDGSVDKSILRVNWGETKKLWAKEYPGKTSKELKFICDKPLIYHLNEHTEGYRFRTYWNKKGSNAANRGLYSIIFTFTNMRNLAKTLKENYVNVEYYE